MTSIVRPSVIPWEGTSKELREFVLDVVRSNDARSIMRKEVSQYFNERQRKLVAELGMLTVEGKVEFLGSPGHLEARVDHTDIAQFLAAHCDDGQRIRIVLTVL